jgi:hypothetical protein
MSLEFVAVSAGDHAGDAVLVAGMAIVLLVAASQMRGRVEPGARARPHTRRRSRRQDPAPEDLAQFDRRLRIASSAARDFHFRLRPLLRDLATVLSNTPEDAARDPDLAAAFADVRAPDDLRRRGPSARELDRIIRAVERRWHA